MPPSGLTAVILAGGTSSRLGTDKAHLPWGATTLIGHVIETLQPLVNELIVVVRDAKGFRNLNVKVVKDLVSASALGGLYTGLKMASRDVCFVCACDAPFLNVQLIRFLVGQLNGYDLVIPESRRGLEPLHAVYARSALGAIEGQLKARQWDLKTLVPKLRAKIIEPAAIHQFDPEGLSCFNLNTAEEYARACTLQKRLTHVIEPSQSYW